MKKVLISLAYNKSTVGDYLVPMNLTGRDFMEWSLKLLRQKNMMAEGTGIKRMMVKIGTERRDISLNDTLGSMGIKEGSLISIL